MDAVVVNRILPGVRSDGSEGGAAADKGAGEPGKQPLLAPSNDLYLRQLQEHQARYLVEIERDFYPLPILYSSWRSEEVVGFRAIAVVSG